MKFFLPLLIFFLSITNTFAQQTMGLFLNTIEAFNGYTLFAGGNNNYLIDNCGELVHMWESDNLPGSSFYLLENGNLIRPVVSDNYTGFVGGGIGGAIEMLDWNSNQLWFYEFNQPDSLHQHHDIEPLPNGNVLILAWSYRDNAEAVAAGRNPNTTGGAIWPTYIAEVEPILPNDGNIVWQWNLWDHLIQDFDSTKLNFGAVEDHPELLDINFIGEDGAGGDWLHCNKIEYIEAYDMIAISSRHLSEIYIIDHSTTTTEAASHTGGNYNKGGDFLYRWGNPQSYKQGTLADKKLFGQHDVEWVPEDFPDAGQLTVFNNGIYRPEGNYSTANSITPPINADGSFDYTPGTAFGPENFSWSFQEQIPTDMFSSFLSSARKMPNGNTLICLGRNGYMFEVNPNKEKVWIYQSPVSSNGPQMQGFPISQLLGSFLSFKVERYEPDFPAFIGKDLTPMGPIELNAYPNECNIVLSNDKELESLLLNTYPNPVNDVVFIEAGEKPIGKLLLFNLRGQLIKQVLGQQNMSVSEFTNGIYYLQVIQENKSGFIKLLKE